MAYYFQKILTTSDFAEAIDRTTEALKSEGFGVLTEIDMKATLKEKLDVEMENYTILGACNPPFAHKAVQAEDKIGLMLPCNVIVHTLSDGSIEVAAIDPVASMQAVNNPSLAPIADEVRSRMKSVIDSL